ncbi:MAG TPA: 50S ribosomal protein L6 [Candidatus Aminicenantes bacterium]|nr:50S ribosomal protein L6 [Candidatus Aminicenantes bacterium]
MSRVGKQPILIPSGVKVDILPQKIKVEGPKGQLESPLFEGIKVEMKDNQLLFSRQKDTPQLRSFHGLCRSLAANAVQGVSQGFEKKLEIVGVGYRAKLDKGRLELYLGYSKPVIYEIPPDIEIVLEKPTLISVRGIDKQRVGQEAYKIRSFRKPDPYKLKGIRYVGEKLHKKERRAGVGGV